MNFGLILLAFFLVGASIFAIFAIASQNQAPVTDSFGMTQSNQTNDTQSMIGNSTAALSGATGGLAILFGFFIVCVAAVFVVKSVGGSNTGRR